MTEFEKKIIDDLCHIGDPFMQEKKKREKNAKDLCEQIIKDEGFDYDKNDVEPVEEDLEFEKMKTREAL